MESDIPKPQTQRRRGNPEWDFQRAAYVFLSAVLPRDSEIQSNDAANKGTRRQRELNASRGIRGGWPDITAAVLGFPEIYIECKARGGRLSPEQQRRGQRLMALGRHWFVADSLVVIEQNLRSIGVPLRGTTLSAAERDARIAERQAAPAKPRAVVKGAPRNKGAALAKLRAAGWLA